MKLISIVVILTLTAFLAGCPKKPAIVKEEAKAPAVGKNEVEEKAGREAEEKAKTEADAKAEARAKKEAEEKAKKEAKLEAGSKEEKKTFMPQDIHFDFDRYDITMTDREVLKLLAEWLLNNKDAKVLIEGHCDERGSSEYNLALGDRRANSIKQYIAILGVSVGRINTITYGEEKPLCAESGEDCWWKNRRAHFVIQ